MFGIFAHFLSSVASFLFPIFASYKALKAGDPSQLTPWLMYWVVLSIALLIESWLGWFLFFVPFYSYARLLFMLYLVLPQTQGARTIYEEYVHPRLEENEAAIEEFIASAHERLKAAGMEYLKRAIEAVRVNVLGLPPSPPEQPQPAQQTPQGYTASLLARFSLPSPRWMSGTGAQPQTGTWTGTAAGNDFYSLLSSAVSSLASPLVSGSASHETSTTPGATPSGLMPETVRSASAAARMTFIQAQRERLRLVLSALEREEQAAQQQLQNEESGDTLSPGKRSRSVGDFEKVDIVEGEEEQGVRRRNTAAGTSSAGEGSGGWLWGWGKGKSSGVEK
ncbi:uncharacterized protein CTHT_0044680 [Thermochaetoides thermophila DSM 1495]|uniref:Protein YOP1 n=1 Tax=Chaetomium thermophilum (strain DSM 1495 / CBS 144.50 / IMI 039719) TaxID=759272 RepID=G0S961_CHATD|nr:hypothetical protein CTHT_0044680 [Thermochaetoides thermophila DSM 1495]EGS19972.1 hypothetical protein CTHT_0044680 [Thermochaetoides thermophila DSM 1495]